MVSAEVEAPPDAEVEAATRRRRTASGAPDDFSSLSSSPRSGDGGRSSLGDDRDGDDDEFSDESDAEPSPGDIEVEGLEGVPVVRRRVGRIQYRFPKVRLAPDFREGWSPGTRLA